ncbi:MAG: hypothetical protein E7571_07925 [Ruminococcaceae bacterium]|nr:hypothetical protein [Oscillospiraceae bacterium]
MDSLIFSFIKRAVIVPSIITAVVIGCLLGASRLAPQQQSTVLSDVVYQQKAFDSFGSLIEGDYVGKITCGSDFAADITFGESVSGSLVLDTDSTEPWKNGRAIVVGTGAANQLGTLRHLKAGDSVTLEVYSNSGYTYKITSVKSGLTFGETKKIKADLLICRSYNDFSDLAFSKLYTVYCGDEVKEGEDE